MKAVCFPSPSNNFKFKSLPSGAIEFVKNISFIGSSGPNSFKEASDIGVCLRQ